MRSMSSPLALLLCGDPGTLLLNDGFVGESRGGKSCSNSTLIGESANVTCLTSSEPVDASSASVGGGVVWSESATIVVVALPVDDGGGVGKRIIAFEAV